jgi:predicted nucleotidyltransferase
MERSVFPDEAALAAFCERNGIRRVSLFGSRLKGTAREDSDVDLLVEFFPESIPGLFGIVRMENTLSEMLGAKFDLRTGGDLSRHFREDVVRTARLQYAA